MKAIQYTAQGGETLKDVAARCHVDYATIVRLNKAFVHTRLRKGAQILLGFMTNEEEKKTEKTQQPAQEDKTTAAAARQAERDAQAARNRALKRQEALAAIENADKEFLQESAYVREDQANKVSRLSELMRNNRNKMEGDLARQKIADSSIAQNQRARLQEQEKTERESIDLQAAHKMEQLERKKDKTKETQNRKLAAL